MITCCAGLIIAALAGMAEPALALISIDSGSDSLQYSPSGSWDAIHAPGAYEGSAMFLLAEPENGIVTFTFPEPAISFQLFGYERSDGGTYSISFDGGPSASIDIYNRNSTGSDAPVLLFSTNALSHTIHTVNITNQLDSRTNSYAQMNLDHIVLDGPPQIPAGSVAYAVEANNAAIQYSPQGSWKIDKAPGSFDSHAMFLTGNLAQGTINYTFSQPATAFELHAYQRSDGGMLSLSIDGTTPSSVDFYNKTSTGSDSSVLLFAASGLSNEVHTISITNQLDSRVGGYGMLNLDHFVLVGTAPAPANPSQSANTVTAPTFPANSFLAIKSLDSPYHVNITLGARASLNGGDGTGSRVLFDTGAGDDWVVWDGCTESQCAGHIDYTSSSTHFLNLTKQDTVSYGSGGPANTMSTWRVNDTVQFGNVSISSTTIGAAFSIPSAGEAIDGNFGMARSFCGGTLCTGYPNFIETMYEEGIIAAPVLAFYQLANGDNVRDGVVSQVAIGGVDRSKYTDSMDWIPLTNDSMWITPGTTRWASAGDGTETQDLTAQFAHTKMTFDTGDPGLLGLPSDDWQTLVSALGAQGPDSSNKYLFPCNSTMTWNFHGTQGRNYTFNLADTTSDNGEGFCKALANDAGGTTNWITGVPFFSHYYTAWYFGERGVGSTLGLGIKNLGSDAGSSSPVIGGA